MHYTEALHRWEGVSWTGPTRLLGVTADVQRDGHLRKAIHVFSIKVHCMQAPRVCLCKERNCVICKVYTYDLVHYVVLYTQSVRIYSA